MSRLRTRPSSVLTWSIWKPGITSRGCRCSHRIQVGWRRMVYHRQFKGKVILCFGHLQGRISLIPTYQGRSTVVTFRLKSTILRTSTSAQATKASWNNQPTGTSNLESLVSMRPWMKAMLPRGPNSVIWCTKTNYIKQRLLMWSTVVMN